MEYGTNSLQTMDELVRTPDQLTTLRITYVLKGEYSKSLDAHGVVLTTFTYILAVSPHDQR